MENYQSNYDDIRSKVRSGDILLCSGNSVFSKLIQKTTNSQWSHVGFIIRIDSIDRIMVLESVENIGVRSAPLSSYVCNYNGSGRGYRGKVAIARHKNMSEDKISNLSKRAVDLLGYKYGNEEILRISSRIISHSLGLENNPFDLNHLSELICSEYAYVCFKSVGIDIKFNKFGFIAPCDFANDENVDLITVLTKKLI